MSFLSKAYRDPRYDRTITSQEMNKQTTMQFDEINQSPIIDDTPTNPDKITLNYDSDTNKLLWTTQGTSSYLSFNVKYNAQSQTVASTTRDFSLPSLSSNTFYSFIVEGLTSFGLTIKSNTIQTTTPAVPPSNYVITALNITTSSFEVSYSFVQNDATNITHIPSIETTSLQSNTEYEVFLTMNYEINGTSFILVSNTITVLTDKEDPVINSFTSPSKDHDEITLNFDTDFNDADASNRVIEIYKDGVLNSSSSAIASGYIVSGLTPNTPYQFQLKLQWYFNGVQQTSINSAILTETTDTLNATNPYFDVQSKTATSITIHNISYGNDDGATRLSNNIYLDNTLVSSTVQTTFTFSGLNEGQTYNIKISKTLEGVASLYEFERNITTFVLAIPASNNGSFTTLQSSTPANSLKWNINAWNDSIPTSIQVIDASNSSIIATLAYTETNYLHASLTQNTNYSYKIRKVFDTGYNDSDVITLQTYQFAEADTINSFVEDFDEITININNKPNHDATLVSQFILFKKSIESTYQYQKTSFGTTVYGLQENTQYDFQIQKITQIETTQFTDTSPVVSTSTAHRPLAPSLSLSSSTPSSLMFNVALNAMNDGTLTSFKFQTKSVSGTWSDYEILTASSTTVTLTPLSSNTTYEVRLKKKYSFNGSDYIITTNLSEKTPYNPVIAVSNITFTNVDTNTLTVNWTRNSDGDDTEVIYKVEYYPTATPTDIQLVQSTTKTDVDISGLIHNTAYTFIVHKFSFINNTQTTATQSTLDVAVGQDIIPSPPTLTIAQIRPTEVDLSFVEEYNGTASSISFNIVYLDSSNTEYVSASIAQNGTGNYTYTLTGLTSNETYRIRVRKSSSLGFVFSDTQTATTPAVGQILPLAPTVNSITLTTNDVSVVYEPRSNGDASTAILEFYYAKQLSSITWEPYVQYDTTRDVISDTSQGTFVFDGLESETVYTLRIKKVTNLAEVETIMYVETLDEGGGGGGGGGGFPFPFPIPPPSGSNPDDPDPDEPEIKTSQLAKKAGVSINYAGGVRKLVTAEN